MIRIRKHFAPALPLRALGACALMAALVSACATVPQGSGSSAEVYTGPRTVHEGYDWIISTDGDEPMLAYGVAQSDDAPVYMECKRGSGQVHVSIVGPDSGTREVILATDTVSRRYAGRTTDSDFHGTTLLETVINATDPVFEAMEKAGWLAVRAGKDWIPFVAQPNTRLEAGRFAKACL